MDEYYSMVSFELKYYNGDFGWCASIILENNNDHLIDIYSVFMIHISPHV